MEEHENQVVTPIGQTDFRDQEAVFGIKKPDRRGHVYILGKTGMGKSTLLESMILSDIYKPNLTDLLPFLSEHMLPDKSKLYACRLY